jgi:hypothetical protein
MLRDLTLCFPIHLSVNPILTAILDPKGYFAIILAGIKSDKAVDLIPCVGLVVGLYAKKMGFFLNVKF